MTEAGIDDQLRRLKRKVGLTGSSENGGETDGKEENLSMLLEHVAVGEESIPGRCRDASDSQTTSRR